MLDQFQGHDSLRFPVEGTGEKSLADSDFQVLQARAANVVARPVVDVEPNGTPSR
jgi:hypothetical protein